MKVLALEAPNKQVAGEASFSGKLMPNFMPDLCQVLARQTGVLEIADARVEGSIFFHEGVAVHAEIPSETLAGSDAFLELSILQNGRFSFFSNVLSAQNTISSKTDRLLLDSAMYSDSMEVITRALIGLDTTIQGRSSAERAIEKLNDPLVTTIFQRLQIRHTPRELIEALKQHHVSRLEVIEALRQLCELGAVEPLTQLGVMTRSVRKPEPVAPAKVEAPKLPSPPPDFGWIKPLAFTILFLVLVGGGILGWFQYRDRLSKIASTVVESLQPSEPLPSQPIDDPAADRSEEISETITYAKAPTFGAFKESQHALSPRDISRLIRNGFNLQDLMKEIENRGFTGFTDEFERRRVLEATNSEMLIATLDASSTTLTKESLGAYLSEQPELRWQQSQVDGAFSGLDQASPQARAQYQTIQAAIAKLMEAKVEFEQLGLDPVILDLKLLLLEKELSDLTSSVTGW